MSIIAWSRFQCLNCFKHCNRDQAIIDILIRVEGDKLYLRTKNNLGASGKDKPGGLGIINVSRRLEMIYKTGYKLEYEERGNFYEVILELNLIQGL